MYLCLSVYTGFSKPLRGERLNEACFSLHIGIVCFALRWFLSAGVKLGYSNSTQSLSITFLLCLISVYLPLRASEIV